MSDPKGKIVVGALAGAFGVKGEVRLKSFCAEPEAICDYVPLSTRKGHVFAQVVITGQQPNGFIARIDGITTKEEADAVKGLELFADRAALPSLPDDEFYHSDLIGMEVRDTGGTVLGTVKAVLNHGAGDILEILLAGQSKTLLLPFTRAAVPTVDLTARRIVADPPEGAL